MKTEIFQSTLPQGERRYNCTSHNAVPYFNPRSHEGSDFTSNISFDQLYNFNPRPTRGATRVVDIVGCLTIISIHAPTRGATSRGFRCLLCRYFNPRSHEGSDIFPPFNGTIECDFNPRSHEGSDHVVGIPFKGIWDFNPRSHEGSDDKTRVLLHNAGISIHAPTRGAT